MIALGSKGSGRKAAEVVAACQEALTGTYDMCNACPNSDSVSKLLPYLAETKHTDSSLMFERSNVQKRCSHPEIHNNLRQADPGRLRWIFDVKGHQWT